MSGPQNRAPRAVRPRTALRTEPRTSSPPRPPAHLVRPVHHGQRLGVALLDVGRAVRLREHPHPGPHLPQLRSAAPVRAVPLVRQQLQRRHRDPGVPRADCDFRRALWHGDFRYTPRGLRLPARPAEPPYEFRRSRSDYDFRRAPRGCARTSGSDPSPALRLPACPARIPAPPLQSQRAPRSAPPPSRPPGRRPPLRPRPRTTLGSVWDGGGGRNRAEPTRAEPTPTGPNRAEPGRTGLDRAGLD